MKRTNAYESAGDSDDEFIEYVVFNYQSFSRNMIIFSIFSFLST